jgi:hypothetical protein
LCSCMRRLEAVGSSVTLHSNRGRTPIIYQHCPFFNYKVIAVKSRTFVVKSRTAFATEIVRDLNAKMATMGDGGRGSLGLGSAQGNCDPSLSRAAQTQRRKHRRSGETTGLEPEHSLQAPRTISATASDLFPACLGSAVASRMSRYSVMSAKLCSIPALMSSISGLSVLRSQHSSWKFVGALRNGL